MPEQALMETNGKYLTTTRSYVPEKGDNTKEADLESQLPVTSFEP